MSAQCARSARMEWEVCSNIGVQNFHWYLRAAEAEHEWRVEVCDTSELRNHTYPIDVEFSELTITSRK